MVLTPQVTMQVHSEILSFQNIPQNMYPESSHHLQLDPERAQNTHITYIIIFINYNVITHFKNHEKKIMQRLVCLKIHYCPSIGIRQLQNSVPMIIIYVYTTYICLQHACLSVYSMHTHIIMFIYSLSVDHGRLRSGVFLKVLNTMTAVCVMIALIDPITKHNQT